MLFALAGQSMPVFWVGVMLILVFGVKLQWLPVAGREGLSSLVLPTIALGLFSVARNARIVRSSMLEVLGADYVRTGRAKGLKGLVVVWKHAVRIAINPMISILSMRLPEILSCTIIVSIVMGHPTVGPLW